MTKHSKYNPSGATRWRQCPGSNALIQDALDNGAIVKDNSTVYSQEGTKAHDYADECLKDNILRTDIPEEFRVHLDGYIAHCRGIEKEVMMDDHMILNETKIPLFYRPQDTGTVDHAVICPGKFIHATDLKYGAGVHVSAKDNSQQLIYVASMIDELEIMHGMTLADDLPVFISIYQPRHFEFTGEADTWELTVAEVKEIATEIAKDYEIARTATKDDICPSEEACMFCEAKGICAKRIKPSFTGLQPILDINNDFDYEEEKKPEIKLSKKERDELCSTLSPEEVTWICKNGGQIKKIIDSVIGAETKRLQAGGEIKGMKLIPGKQGNRTWKDPEKAEKVLRTVLGAAEAYKPRVLLTAPQALAKAKAAKEKLSAIRQVQLGLADEETMKKSKTECLIHRPEGKPQLVSADHEVEALLFGVAEDDFQIEE